MPSPLLQLRIPQDLADWLEAKYPSRGEVAEYVRQLLTAEQMKEAVAPLVPEDGDFYSVERDGVSMTIARRGVRPEDIVIPEAKPKARRKKLADPPGTHRDKSIDAAERRMAIKSGLIPPDRCNRGACTGTIKPNGRCIRCNQEPLRESK